MKIIHDIFNHEKVRAWCLKLRYPLFILLVILFIPLLDSDWFIPGLIISILGELLQIWSLATIKTQKEITRVGPYMFVRNPMYIGRFFLIFGILLMSGNLWLLIAFTIIYYFYMINRVSREEKKLTKKFGQEYVDYCQRVNRYWPNCKNYRADRLTKLSADNFLENNGHFNILVVILCYIIFYWASFT